MNNPTHLTLTNPLNNHFITLSPKEFTLIFDSLDNHRTNSEAISLSIKLGDFADNQGFPTA